MGIVWEACHKGVPLLGVPGITLEWVWHGPLPGCNRDHQYDITFLVSKKKRQKPSFTTVVP